ncbi:MAG: DUF1214 domain-containing protein [Paracoccaceae bacterium]
MPRLALLHTLALIGAAWLAAPAAADDRVTVENFTRAETDGYFTDFVARAGGVGQFYHTRTPTEIADQTVVRMNRDTLYSSAVLDLTTPATITLPDAGKRFMSMLVISQDHYVKDVVYAPSSVALTQESVGTRYVNVVLRIFVDPNDPADVAKANVLQDQVVIAQAEKGKLELPAWNQTERLAIRDLLNRLGPYRSGFGNSFGDKNEVEPVAHLIGTAAGWGGNPAKAAIYVPLVPPTNDGVQAYTMTLKDVPVDGFWSVTIYNKDGYMEGEAAQAAVNNVTGKAEADGSFVLHLGGDAAQANHLHIMPGWGAVLRLYRPRAEILSGEWTAPPLVPVQ